MGLQNELEKVKHEQELALQAAQEEERKIQTHRDQLRQANLSQRRNLISYWTAIISTLLDETARTSWGDDKYTLIQPDGSKSLTWTVVRVQGKSMLNYQVNLEISDANLEDPAINPNDELVHPSGFKVMGKEDFISPLSEQGLKDSLISAFRSGPKDGGLDQYTESILAKSPYKEGEFEVADWKVIVFPGISILLGFQLLGSGDAGGVLLGLLLMALAGYALTLTQLGKQFRRLPTWQKATVIAAAIPGVCAGGFVILGIAGLILYFMGAAQREHRVSEIEEGVKRAIK